MRVVDFIHEYGMINSGRGLCGMAPVEEGGMVDSGGGWLIRHPVKGVTVGFA